MHIRDNAFAVKTQESPVTRQRRRCGALFGEIRPDDDALSHFEKFLNKPLAAARGIRP